MPANGVSAALRNTSLFGDLDERSMSALVEKAIPRSYRKGESVFHQGDTGEALFVVAKGVVKVYLISEEGDEMVLATLHPGDTFGELALLDGGPRSASATAIQDATLLALTRVSFMEMVANHPPLRDALFRSVGRLLRHTLEYASDLVFLDLPGRVAKLLVAMAAERGEETPEGTLLDLQLSQTTLATMVGGSRPTVNQILRSFESRGYLELRGRKILIKRSDLLQRRATP